MQTATALAELEQELKENKGNDPSLKLDFIDRQAPRYLFFGTDMPGAIYPNYPQGGFDIGSPCIPTRPRGYLARCAITPVLMGAAHTLGDMMPEGIPLLMQRPIAGATQFTAQAKDTSLTSYPILPGPEVDQAILPNYAQCGLVELTVLRGKDWREVGALGIEKRFFPQYPNLPEKNVDVIAMIDEGIARLREEAKAASKLSKDEHQTLLTIIDCGIAMRKGLVQTEAYMRGILEDTHGKMQLAPTDPFRKAKYDTRDLHFLARTGLERTDGFIESQVRKQAENTQDVNALATKLIEFLAKGEEKRSENESLIAQILNRLTPQTGGSADSAPETADETQKAKRK